MVQIIASSEQNITQVRPRRSTARHLGAFARYNPTTVAGGFVGLLIVFLAIAAPLIGPYDRLKTNFRRIAKPPDAHNYFGSDQIGRDTLSRVIYGACSSLVVAFGAVLLGTTVGSVWGMASGYLGGKFDLMSQRIMAILQSFPDLILAMAISMTIGTGMPAVIVAIAVTRIPFNGRVIRSVALTVKELAYVSAWRPIWSWPPRIWGWQSASRQRWAFWEWAFHRQRLLGGTGWPIR